MIEEPDYEKLKAKADAGELTPTSLQEELNAYSKALKQEWEEKQAADDSPENVEALTQDYFKKHAAQAAAQIVWLSMNSDSETVQLNASKYVLEHAIGDSTKDGDPLKQLLKELAGNDKKAVKATTTT